MVAKEFRKSQDGMSVIRRRPTLGDVARRAEVSAPTVSKVLNGHTDVSAGTRQRVQQAIDALGYVRRQPRAPAGSNIEVMVDQMVTPYAAEILGGVTRAAESVDADVIVGPFHRSGPDRTPLAPGAWARRLANRGRSGAIVLTAHLSPSYVRGLNQEHLPVVVVDPLDLTNPEVPSVGSTNWAGGFAATEHLLRLGHRRIAAIGGRRESIAANARISGYRAALGGAGQETDPAQVEFAGFDFDSGLQVARRWLSRENRPTAIVAASDTQALGVLAATAELGLRVPDDLSVVGYDDTHVAGWTVPALTTVRQPLQEMGRVAMRMVLELVRGEQLDSRHIELATELIVRASTSAPHSRTRENNDQSGA